MKRWTVVDLVVSSLACVGLIRLFSTRRARKRVKNNAQHDDGPMVRTWSIDCSYLESHISLYSLLANL
jgi:hypothetical protein